MTESGELAGSAPFPSDMQRGSISETVPRGSAAAGTQSTIKESAAEFGNPAVARATRGHHGAGLEAPLFRIRQDETQRRIP